jgi:sugar/nucleoside kinase (ribokinase family)
MKKILGMGNALVDIMIPIEDDAILEHLRLPKGSMQLVDLDHSKAIQEKLMDHKKSISAGGSVANTIHGLGKLGASCGYIGVVGEDELGGYFVKDMINAGVDPHMIHSRKPTGFAVALISPDSERTFATFLGAAIELSADHMGVGSQQSAAGSKVIASETKQQHPASSIQHPASGIFKKYDYFHVEGYLVQNHDLIEAAAKLAKEAGLMVSIDMASYNVVEGNKEFLYSVVEKYVDIVFANEDEAKAFAGTEPEEALEYISKRCKIAVVKTGNKGSMIKSGDLIIPVGIIPVKPVDTTGAGDLYASGFLYGLANDKPLVECGRLGALLAGNVIEVIGSKMEEERWVRIFSQL